MKKLFYIIITCFFCFVLTKTVFAISIFPLRQTVSINPGAEATLEIAVKNDVDEEVSVYPSVEAFTVDENDGSAVFGVDDEALAWVEYNRNDFVLLPDEDRSFEFKIKIPANAEPGTHYLGLFANRKRGEGQISISSRVGSLLFLHVAGLIQEELVRKNFLSDKNIYFNDPINLSIDFENVGSTHSIPEGNIVITDIFGRELKTVHLNPDRRIVVPHTNWKGRYSFDKLPLTAFGPFKIKMNMRYGLNQQTMVDSITVWYISWRLLLAVPIIVILLSVIILIKKKKNANI